MIFLPSLPWYPRIDSIIYIRSIRYNQIAKRAFAALARCLAAANVGATTANPSQCQEKKMPCQAPPFIGLLANCYRTAVALASTHCRLRNTCQTAATFFGSRAHHVFSETGPSNIRQPLTYHMSLAFRVQ